MIQPVLQQLAASNPGVAQALAQNPEALMRLLGLDEEGAATGGPGGQHVVEVTAEENEAILRVSRPALTYSILDPDLIAWFPFIARSSWIPSSSRLGGIHCL